MLKFYYNPISVNARRVWVTLLEKQISFEPILVDLDGEQFSAEFTAINPLQRIPVVIDYGFKLVESLAILDYLEAKYPHPRLLPPGAEALATVKMVEMTAVNELQTATIPLTKQLIGLEIDEQKLTTARQQINRVVKFYEDLLDKNSYLVGNQLTLADIVAGTLAPSLSHLGFSLDPYPNLTAWLQKLEQRESWQQTALQPEMIQVAIPHIREILSRRL